MTTEDKKGKSDSTAEQAKVSRRSFIKGTAIAGAGAAAILQSENSEAQDSNAAKIRIPDEIPKTLAEAAKPANFPMTGAEVFAKFCNDEGVAGFFCCPGNYNMINAIAAEGIPISKYIFLSKYLILSWIPIQIPRYVEIEEFIMKHPVLCAGRHPVQGPSDPA